MKKIELQTEFPCLIITDNEQTFLSPTDILTIDASSLLVYPVENKVILPFKVDLNKFNGKNYSIFEKNNMIYCFLFSANQLTKKAKSNIKIDSKEINVKVSQNEITISCETEEISFPIEDKLNQYTISTWQKHLQGILCFDKFDRLFLYNPKNGIFKTYKGKNFETNDNSISFDQTTSNFARCSLRKKLSLSSGEIKEEILSSQHQSYRLQEECIAYAFLDAIIQDNIPLAKELLCDELKDTESKKIRAYFGNFFKFFPLTSSEFVLIYQNECKPITFTTKDKKIIDFEFVEK